MENNNNNKNEKLEIKKENKQISKEEKSKPLFEDLNGHKHDDASFKKLIKEQENRQSKTGI